MRTSCCGISGLINTASLLVMMLLAACGRQDPAATAKNSADESPQQLRVLAWVGYDEREFLDPIKQALGVDIVVKTYVGGDQMYSLLNSAPPHTYDVVVVDAEYGRKLFNEGRLNSLDKEVWSGPDLFEPFSRGEPAREGDSVYGAVVRWGALGLVYNRNKVSAEQAQDYGVLWSPELAGHVGIFDWYLPSMGVISRYQGHATPYALSAEQLSEVRAALLKLRPGVRTIHQNTGDVISDLRNEEVYITPGIGEWAAAVLAEEGKPIDWSVPKQGGVMWVEALAIPEASRHQELAKRFIAVVRQPQHLARLAWRKAYHSQVTVKGAYQHLPAERRQLLKAENLDELQQLIDRLSIRQLPSNTSESDWLRVWTEFKAAR